MFDVAPHLCDVFSLVLFHQACLSWGPMVLIGLHISELVINLCVSATVWSEDRDAPLPQIEFFKHIRKCVKEKDPASQTWSSVSSKRSENQSHQENFTHFFTKMWSELCYLHYDSVCLYSIVYAKMLLLFSLLIVGCHHIGLQIDSFPVFLGLLFGSMSTFLFPFIERESQKATRPQDSRDRDRYASHGQTMQVKSTCIPHILLHLLGCGSLQKCWLLHPEHFHWHMYHICVSRSRFFAVHAVELFFRLVVLWQAGILTCCLQSEMRQTNQICMSVLTAEA